MKSSQVSAREARALCTRALYALRGITAEAAQPLQLLCWQLIRLRRWKQDVGQRRLPRLLPLRQPLSALWFDGRLRIPGM